MILPCLFEGPIPIICGGKIMKQQWCGAGVSKLMYATPFLREMHRVYDKKVDVKIELRVSCDNVSSER